MMHFRDRQINAAIEAGGRSALEVKHLTGPMEIPNIVVVSGYRLADDYYYHPGHSWARLEQGGRMKIGIDDFIVKVFGQAGSLKLPDRGTVLGQGGGAVVCSQRPQGRGPVPFDRKGVCYKPAGNRPSRDRS